jgi:hypothetical protein
VNPHNDYQRCLAAARACQRNPSLVAKSGDFPTREEFDAAIDELADVLWDSQVEPCWKAYARALDSSEGQLLYAARELAPVPEPPFVRKREEPVTKAEERIQKAVTEYVARHAGVPRERALIQVLENNPSLYTAYLRERR